MEYLLRSQLVVKKRIVPDELARPPEVPVRTERLLELDVRVMTALYGGGAAARINDGDDPFRIPSIRGQLRFWWRATIGGQYADEVTLRAAEAAVWGDTERASRVRLRMISADRGTERLAEAAGADGRPQKVQPQYALFPAQEDRRNIGKLYYNGRFRMEVAAAEDVIPHVDAALWAWLTFGGVGGRTRRGAGALDCGAYRYQWKPEIFLGSGSRTWPILKGGTVVMGSTPLPWQKCWEASVEVLKEYRQDRNGLRGRSKWPEADEIRRLRDRWAPHHVPAPENFECGFPRAAFGLPIVFKFNQQGNRTEDPDVNTLDVPDPSDGGKDLRMASPVILKPWAISEREAIPLLVVLNAPGPPDLVLRQKGEESVPVGAGKPGLLDDFARFVEEKWRGRTMAL